MANDASPFFREEALDHHRTQRADGAVVRIAPGWTRWTYWLVVWSVLLALFVLAVVRVTVRGAGVRAGVLGVVAACGFGAATVGT